MRHVLAGTLQLARAWVGGLSRQPGLGVGCGPFPPRALLAACCRWRRAPPPSQCQREGPNQWAPWDKKRGERLTFTRLVADRVDRFMQAYANKKQALNGEGKYLLIVSPQTKWGGVTPPPQKKGLRGRKNISEARLGFSLLHRSPLPLKGVPAIFCRCDEKTSFSLLNESRQTF